MATTTRRTEGRFRSANGAAAAGFLPRADIGITLRTYRAICEAPGDREVFPTDGAGCGRTETGLPARCRGEGIRRLVRWLTTAILAAATGCAAGAHAQSRSRADAQLGALLAGTGARPGVVMGGTGWVTGTTGVSVQAYFISGRWNRLRMFETSVRQRGFVNGVEVDFGMGLLFISPNPFPEWGEAVTAEVLFGWRLAERLGVKAGMNFVHVVDEEASGYFVMKFLAAVPLGSF